MYRLIVLLFCTLFAAQAQAQTGAFKYVSESGVSSYVDKEERIPARYRSGAERITLHALKDYNRFTLVVKVEVPTTRLIPEPPPKAVLTGLPYTIVRERRWLPNINSAPGDSYVSVDILVDTSGRELIVVRSAVGFGPLYFKLQ